MGGKRGLNNADDFVPNGITHHFNGGVKPELFEYLCFVPFNGAGADVQFVCNFLG